MRLARSNVSISVELHGDATHVALLIADHDPIADLDRALGQQDQARHEVVHDRLQAEADADRQSAGDDGEVRDIEAGVGHRHQRREADAGIAHRQLDRVGDPGIHPALRQHTLAQPVLEIRRRRRRTAAQ